MGLLVVFGSVMVGFVAGIGFFIMWDALDWWTMKDDLAKEGVMYHNGQTYTVKKAEVK